MSLVSEALRKARREAVQRGRQSRLPASLPEPAGGRSGARFGVGLVVGAAIALAAALLGAAATWWLATAVPEKTSGASAAPTAVATVAERVATSPPAPVAAVPTAEPTRAALVPTSTPRPEVEDLRPGAGSTLEDRAGSPPAGSAPPRARQSEEHPRATPPAGPRGTRGERVFVLDADLGYARLSLDFVVARPTDPFAGINGQEVHVGTEVEGFVVEEITAQGVRLSDARGPLELRLR